MVRVSVINLDCFVDEYDYADDYSNPCSSFDYHNTHMEPVWQLVELK